MNTNIQVARLLGIPVVVNVSWLVTLVFVTSMLALRFYPSVIPEGSPYREDKALHWVMAISSGLIFFASILLHELAHSFVALRQGIPVKSITLFIFGGVSQIGGEASRPLHEFIMAIMGPLTSVFLGLLFFGFWWATGFASDKPLPIVLEWLFLMNMVLAAFNMAPGFPMDGGRVLRSLLWGISGNLFRATRLATLIGRSLGFSLMMLGGLAFFGLFGFVDALSGLWFVILGLFLESSARQSWFQAKALDLLARHSAEELMAQEVETAARDDRLHVLSIRGGKRFMFLIADENDRVVGVVTEKEVEAVPPRERDSKTAADVMLPTDAVPVAMPREDAASVLQRMEIDSIWHMPVVSEGRVIGVVSKESLLRLLARGLFTRPNFVGQP
ncbi:MAG TPA: site-2 protease family protein [Dehalococcoidia bacterium]|nr:site-2 protease family protein [Dehalococcoidia bacterium]